MKVGWDWLKKWGERMITPIPEAQKKLVLRYNGMIMFIFGLGAIIVAPCMALAGEPDSKCLELLVLGVILCLFGYWMRIWGK